MQDLARIEAYVDRSYYQKTLDDLRTEHDNSYYIGRRNPYNGRKIETEQDVELYLQQLAMSIMYRQAANMALSKIRQDTKRQIEDLEDEVLDLKAEQKGYLAEIGDVRSQLQAMERKKGRTKFIAILLAVFLGISTYSQLNSETSRASTGSSSPSYTYTQPTTASSQASLSTAKPTVKPTATAKPKPTATQKPNAAVYKTTPRDGIDLTRTVYVSRNGKIHLRDNCSGMIYSTAMSYGEACEKGYDHCKKCF